LLFVSHTDINSNLDTFGLGRPHLLV